MDSMDHTSIVTSESMGESADVTSAARVRLELADLSRRRQTLMAQLGEAVFERTHTDALARKDDEFLYAAIESLDKTRIELQETLDRLREGGAQDASMTSMTALTCPSCGSEVMRGDLFCMTCGIRLVETKQAEEVPVQTPTVEEASDASDASETETADLPVTTTAADVTEEVDSLAEGSEVEGPIDGNEDDGQQDDTSLESETAAEPEPRP